MPTRHGVIRRGGVALSSATDFKLGFLGDGSSHGGQADQNQSFTFATP